MADKITDPIGSIPNFVLSIISAQYVLQLQCRMAQSPRDMHPFAYCHRAFLFGSDVIRAIVV